jgi:hypothetical protein
MFGIKTAKGWLKPTLGPTRTFFVFDAQPHFPFRSREGARQIADDWLARLQVAFEVRDQASPREDARRPMR